MLGSKLQYKSLDESVDVISLRNLVGFLVREHKPLVDVVRHVWCDKNRTMLLGFERLAFE